MTARNERARRSLNHPSGSGDLPPSTHAAQIVDDLANGNRGRANDGQALLQQLLREILQSDQDGQALPGAIETGIDVNYRLIYVISRAGLDVLHHENPFDRQLDLQSQALQCLAAIDLTIQRFPNVLFYVPVEIQPQDQQPQGPLFLWLVPQLANLLTRDINDQIRHGIEKTLKKAMTVQTKSLALRTRFHPVLKYIQGCIKDLLLFLEAPSNPRVQLEGEQDLASFRVPTVETVSEVYPQGVQHGHMPLVPQFNLEEPARIALTVLHLVSIILPSTTPKSNEGRLTKSRLDPVWILEVMTRMSLLFGHMSFQNGSALGLTHCYTLFLKVLHCFISSIAQTRDQKGSFLKATMLLIRLVGEILQCNAEYPPPALENAISWAMLELYILSCSHAAVLEFFCGHLRPVVQEVLARNTDFKKLGTDLEHTMVNILFLTSDEIDDDHALATVTELKPCDDVALREAFRRVEKLGDDVQSSHRLTEQPRDAMVLDNEAPALSENRQAELVEQIYVLLGLPAAYHLNGLAEASVSAYADISGNDQCLLFSLLGQLACVASQGPQTSIGKTLFKCLECDTEHSAKITLETRRCCPCEELITMIINILNVPQVHKMTKPRVAAMRSLRRVLSHTNNPKHLNLGSSTLGKWCLSALRSSLRDLRIAAGQTLTAYLDIRIEIGVLQHNRILALDMLRGISVTDPLSYQETSILAWGQVASVAGEDETNIVLLQLIEYMGHSNPMLKGLAYDELLRITNYNPFAALRLMTPYWRTIAITVVKDINSRPQIAQQMCELLNMSMASFLVLTQVYTVPYLILFKKGDVLRRIAEACDPRQSVQMICTEPANLTATLAYLLLQQFDDVEGMIMELLREASPGFEAVDLPDILRGHPIPLAGELLKVAGEGDELKKTRVHGAISYLAATTAGKFGPAKSSSKKGNVVGTFFEIFVLGIMASFSEVLNETKGPQPTSEKKRCLGAIYAMISLAESHICNGLPQICAALRTAIEKPELCNEAFSAWILLLDTLGEEDIEPLIDPTFAIIAQKWESFSPTTQQRTYDMISQLKNDHERLLREMISTIPSLDSIPLMTKFHDLANLKAQLDVKHHYKAFAIRCQSENNTVVIRALMELEVYLLEHQDFLHETAISEQPDPVVAQLTRSVLDTSARYSDSDLAITMLCAKCLGLIGCLDPTKVDAVRESKDKLVSSNFDSADQTVEFVLFFIEEVLVKAFLSATDTRLQGFLAFAMQELLGFCELDLSVLPMNRDVHGPANYRRWISLPESVRNTLTPFLNSKYTVKDALAQQHSYPIYNIETPYVTWIRSFVSNLLRRGCSSNNTKRVFSICTKIIRGQDISISSFLLPFAALNVLLDGDDQAQDNIKTELFTILSQPLPEDNQPARENLLLCSESVFRTLDYFSKWMQEKKKEIAKERIALSRAYRVQSDMEFSKADTQMAVVETLLATIPAEIISQRAVECGSYARALFHWEQYIRQRRESYRPGDPGLEPLYEKLQDIYTQIDEPDGIEGISAHLQVLNIDQQIIEHRKAGRWTAVQSWYELQLTERPDDLGVQLSLLTSLKESGQHDVLLNQVESLNKSQPSILQSTPFAMEAAWTTGKWGKLTELLSKLPVDNRNDFDVGIGSALVALNQKDHQQFIETIGRLRSNTMKGMSVGATSSLQACHDTMRKLHVLTELELISGVGIEKRYDKPALMARLDQRLSILGAFTSDKQYFLGLRRAVMQLSNYSIDGAQPGETYFSPYDISSSWLTSARLARKGDFMHHAFNAVLHASKLGDRSATIEHSRLLWKEGQHRKAILSLEGAIAANAFQSHDSIRNAGSVYTNDDAQRQQNMVSARAHLLLAKWIDRAGQTQSKLVIERYRNAIKLYNSWEKGHYYLGKHYNKLLESEKAKPLAKQAQTYILGEISKLTIENYIRSLAFGTKYIFQTLPRVITLWLELGINVEKKIDPQYGNDESFHAHAVAQKRRLFQAVNSHVKKYIDRLQAFVFYTAYAQIVARLCHENVIIYQSLIDIIAKVVTTYPQQACWTLLATMKSSSKERSHRGAQCQKRCLEVAKKLKGENEGTEIKNIIQQGQRLSDQLLVVCEGEIKEKETTVSIVKDLGFSHRVTPCRIAIPLESTLTASLPLTSDSTYAKNHKAFPKDTIMISSFLDAVYVLPSLQRPRKIGIRGSDGHVYNLLCKPKDDLRKDQRLMEFNAMINRLLKRDAESSKRRMYIKTYAVTPLNDECGLIEWVDNLKAFRDIVLNLYKQRNIPIHHNEIRAVLDEAKTDEAKLTIFKNRIIPSFPPVFHEWFVEMFPEPNAWFNARLKYTRSCAVMSIVGHVLGLGDRHGENILFEEGNGGTFHVDFNCLFDKGLTFDKPELVPFRLTHNMVNAFGSYGYEGPFRKTCELTMGILRQHEDTLMTILETFVHDPTADFIGKKRAKIVNGVPDTPEGVLESVKNKVTGLFPGESAPLSIEGYVQELILQATDPVRLASMYIGWCSFF